MKVPVKYKTNNFENNSCNYNNCKANKFKPMASTSKANDVECHQL
jgi:hypothetical protein